MNFPGGSCFAPESLADGDGRRVFWAWVLDQRQGEWLVANELGVMTLPRVLSLDAAGGLCISPAQELKGLRCGHRRVEDGDVSRLAGSVMELALSADLGRSGILELGVRVSPDGEEKTTITVDAAAGTLSVDMTRSTLALNMNRLFPLMRGEPVRTDVQSAPLVLGQDEPLDLRVYLDRSIVEIFANGRQCVTARIYPTREDSLAVTLVCRGGTALRSIDAWQLTRTNGV